MKVGFFTEGGFEGKITLDNINIRTGIFQGDCPSGFHFIICLLPLSWLLKRTKIGYNISGRNTPTIKTSHLLFMDDLKLYASNDSNLETLLEVSENSVKTSGWDLT